MTSYELDRLIASKIKVNRQPRKSTRAQVREAKKSLMKDIREELVSKKRELPQEWQKGMVIAMDIIDRYNEKI